MERSKIEQLVNKHFEKMIKELSKELSTITGFILDENGVSVWKKKSQQMIAWKYYVEGLHKSLKRGLERILGRLITELIQMKSTEGVSIYEFGKNGVLIGDQKNLEALMKYFEQWPAYATDIVKE